MYEDSSEDYIMLVNSDQLIYLTKLLKMLCFLLNLQGNEHRVKCFDKYGAADRKPYINKYTGDGLIDLAKYICASTCYDHHATNKVTIASVCSSIFFIGSFYLFIIFLFF